MYEIEKSHVIASILDCKIRFFNEYFVSYVEANIIKRAIQERLEENKLDAYTSSIVDERYFTIHPVYAPIYSFETIKYHYEHIPDSKIAEIVWDETFIISKLQEIYQEKLEYLKTLINDQKRKNK